MLNKVIQILLFAGLLYSQQQVDIPWPTLANSDWPMVKHDPQFTGRSPFKGPQTPNIAWIKDMQHGIFSGPVIGENGNIFFGSYHINADNFYSFNSDGKLLWEFESGTNRPNSGILIDSSNTIYFGSRDSNLYALNPDGTLKWKFKTSASIVQAVIPNIDLEGSIYVTNFIFDPSEPDRGELYSIKPDGTLNWKVMYDNGFAFKSPVFSPDGNTIYIAGVDSNLFALNLDGNIKWKFSCGAIKKAPLVDSNGNIYFLPTEIPQYFYSLNSDGTIRWKITIQNPSNMYTVPTIDYSGNIYFIGNDTTCCPYYLSLISLNYNGEFRWSYLLDALDPYSGTDDFWQPLICDSEGTVYVGSTFGFFYYAISSEGKLKWLLPLTEQEQQVDNTGALAKDGTLYLGVHDVSVFPGHKKTLIAIRDTGTVSVGEENVEIKAYLLSQNYPNPFNSNTNISYSLPVKTEISLKVFDVLGNEITTLDKGEKFEGSYKIQWNGKDKFQNNVNSGIYFIQLATPFYNKTIKGVLLK